MNVSKKLGLVPTSSTETEVLAGGDLFPKCGWFRCFRIAQGSLEKEDMLMQDNQSCIVLHKHHHFSVGKGSKHDNVRCFFVVDMVDKKEVRLVCYPIEKMMADYSTKPTQSIFSCTNAM